MALAEKRAVGETLNERGQVDALNPAEPPTTQVEQPPYPLAQGTATTINQNSTAVLGTQNPGAPNSTAWVFNGQRTIFGQPGSDLNVFGPGDAAGGAFGGDPVFLPPPFTPGENPILLPVSPDVTGGDVRGGSTRWFGGFVNESHAPFEQAAAWVLIGGSSGSRARASALRFKGYKVGKFKGGSSLFAVSGNVGFGDHFDHGISGRFRAFRLDLRKRTKTELFRPRGGSSQPLASNRAGVGAGGSKFANGSLRPTYWWGSKHYLRFASAGTGSYVAGMNDAGVGVGVIGPANNQHAALFEHGKAYDLNTLIPSGSGWTLTKATAINNQGIVVGTGIRGGVQRGFLLNLSAKRS